MVGKSIASPPLQAIRPLQKSGYYDYFILSAFCMVITSPLAGEAYFQAETKLEARK